MKIDTLHITDTEMEIMKLIWQFNKPTTIAEIGLAMSHKQWKPSTIHTLTSHLVDKGILKYFQMDGKNYYIPYITEFDYNFVVTKTFVDTMYRGSLADMLRVLLRDLELTEEKLGEIYEVVNTAVLLSGADEPDAETKSEMESETAEDQDRSEIVQKVVMPLYKQRQSLYCHNSSISRIYQSRGGNDYYYDSA